MENKRVLQISLDIVVGCECDGYELADTVLAELNRRGFNVIGASCVGNMTDEYTKHCPELLTE